jgi:hypothetical protein
VIWAGLFLKYDPNSLRKKPLINKWENKSVRLTCY